MKWEFQFFFSNLLEELDLHWSLLPTEQELLRNNTGAMRLGFAALLKLTSFHPERVLFRPGIVNLRVCLCGVPRYASAQTLDFLAMTKNASFPNWKL
ncbi:hypothetical protein SBDP1_1470001 [Syntrophobacter sp. SbD1]|nr:hypothetical protein SBDP1_1470001 [Syntrophobacter sp. SbD1]